MLTFCPKRGVFQDNANPTGPQYYIRRASVPGRGGAVSVCDESALQQGPLALPSSVSPCSASGRFGEKIARRNRACSTLWSSCPPAGPYSALGRNTRALRTRFAHRVGWDSLGQRHNRPDRPRDFRTRPGLGGRRPLVQCRRGMIALTFQRINLGDPLRPQLERRRRAVLSALALTKGVPFECVFDRVWHPDLTAQSTERVTE